MRSFQRKPVFIEVTNHIIPPKNDGIVFLKIFLIFVPFWEKKFIAIKTVLHT